MHRLKEIAVLALLILTFLSAAKTHGRQHRLERELRGYRTVSFTERSKNDPWVNRFWFRHRIVYWSIASVMATTLVSLRSRFRKSGCNLYAVQSNRISAWILFLIQVTGNSMIVAFFLTGIGSAVRFMLSIREIPPPGDSWLQEAIQGSIGWWLLTSVFIFLLCLVVRASVHHGISARTPHRASSESLNRR